MKKSFVIVLLSLLLSSCENETSLSNDNTTLYKYPSSKIWKHGVYSQYQAQQLEGVFDGLEVDIIYSKEKDNIYVGREVADTSKNLTLDEWFSVLKNPNQMSYWIDFKNLSKNNAEAAFIVMDKLVDKYNIAGKFFIESKDVEALKFAKEKNYHVLLWVENLHYWKKKDFKDTLFVMNKIRSQIKELQPDAISCEYTMFPLLCDSFPEQNIHFWDTPKKYTPENVAFTKRLNENKSVKVILVDYPTPDDFK